jgi:hypothetical protein
MILPTNEECCRIVIDLRGDIGLSQWERDFLESNRDRETFTDKQREVFADLKEKYD